MKIDFTDVLFAFSYGLDCVEQSVAGISSHHSGRVAFLVSRMGKRLGMDWKERMDLAGCALLHDNALSEYLREERSLNRESLYAGHCIRGEENIKVIPFETDVTGIIRYHHEKADGTGTFKKTAEETPIGAQLIHLADVLDVNFDFSVMSREKWENMTGYLKEQREKEFSGLCTDIFLQEFSEEDLNCLTKNHLEEAVRQEFPVQVREYDSGQIKDICRMFANIIDYKSEFTTRHSMGVAQKAEQMAGFYGYGAEKTLKFYFAGAVHDIGKLVVSTDILEKPDKLTREEYRNIQNHAMETYRILDRIKGLNDIRDWASLHHEKLNGTGYPFGKTKEELGEEARLMGCIDIYQALTEERPYKDGMSHSKTIGIMKKMAEEGFIDGRIVQDMDRAFGTGARKEEGEKEGEEEGGRR